MEIKMDMCKAYVLLFSSALASSSFAEKSLEEMGCRSVTDLSVPQYIIGYGSLMQEKSKREDNADVGLNVPVYVKGFERGWIEHSEDKRFGTTYLGARSNPQSKINAVYFKLKNATDIKDYDKRENTYCRVNVPKDKIQPLAGMNLPDGQYWIYTTLSKTTLPSAQYPLAQSYVDIFLSGCLELEDKYHLNGFAKDCVTTTGNWSGSWVNDRLYPRTAYDNITYAPQIESLISENLPQYASEIKIE